MAKLVESKHRHGWNEEESNWNSTGMKIGIMGAGIIGGMLMFGIPAITTGKIVYDISAHAKEVEGQLTWVVNEIETLYDQINSLMIANIV